MKKQMLFLILILSFSFSSAYATIIPIPGLSSFTVGGNEMGGMQVTVNGSSTKTWTAMGGDKGGAGTSDWSLSFDGDNTFNADWVLSTEGDFNITSLTIDAYLGNTYFDVFYYHEILDTPPETNPAKPGYSTDGSKRGFWQEIGTDPYIGDGTNPMGTNTGTDGSFDWSFSNPIALDSTIDSSNPNGVPVGDLFGSLTINFLERQDVTGWNSLRDGDFSFKLDTDLNISSEVPEPATMLLFGLGLLGLGALGRRKKA